jgi:hypothetical protein
MHVFRVMAYADHHMLQRNSARICSQRRIRHFTAMALALRLAEFIDRGNLLAKT